MKRLILISVLFCLSICAHSQLRIGIGYNYMIAGGWDRAIQTYNFARPELTNKQPLLIHGTAVSASYLWPSEKTMKHGFTTSYRYFRSSVQNENFDVTLNTHLVSLGYMIHNSAAARNGRFTMDVAVNLVLGGIYRNVNGDALRDDGKRIWAPGIGGELVPRIAYILMAKEKTKLAIYFQTTYCPFYYSPRAEAVLNQTMTLTGTKYTGILSMEVGIIITRVTAN